VIRLEAVSAFVPAGGRSPAAAGSKSAPRAILRDLDAAFGPGESHLILGSNGSGKTTLVRILAGLGHPSAGRYLLDGAEVRADRPVETLWPRVATLLEEPDPQFLAETVEGEIAFGLESLDLAEKEARARVADAMDSFGVTDLAARAPLTLSAGEKARVLLAAAMAGRPRVLLLDQSLAHLDPGSRRALEARLVEEARTGGWTILRTHQDDDPPLPGERLWTLESGSLRDASALAPADVLGGGSVPFPLALRVSAFLASQGRWTGPLARDASSLAAGLRGAAPDALDALGGLVPHLGPGRRSPRAGESRGDASDVVISLRGASWSPPGGRPTIWGVDLDLRRGEAVALIGASGSGKTTILKLAAGLLDPSAGEARRKRERRRPPAALALEYPERQLFGRTVLEDVGAPLWIAGVATAERLERASAALSRMGLEPARFAARPPFSLSEGEKRRVALAGLLVDSPPALLLDEPTAGLDPQGRRALARTLEELCDEGHAVLLASHDLDFVCSVAGRVIVLGKDSEEPATILGEGPAPEVFAAPAILERAGLPVPEILRLGEVLRRAVPGASRVGSATPGGGAA
jgi:energy-coupling factor transporter ATP-binding protein EcfA2